MSGKAMEVHDRRQRHHMARVTDGSELERLAAATSWLRAERKRRPDRANTIDDLARDLADRIVTTIQQLERT